MTIRDDILDDLRAGVTHSTETAARKFNASPQHVRRCWVKLRLEIHVCRWVKAKTEQGRLEWIPVYAIGAGEDKPRPRNRTPAECSRAWAKKHPERAAIHRARRHNKSAVHRIDPVLAALMGV